MHQQAQPLSMSAHSTRGSSLEVLVSPNAHCRELRVRGDIDISSMAVLSVALDRVIDEDGAAGRARSSRSAAHGDQRVVVVDLSDLGFISARGVGEMLRADRALRAQGRLLVLVNVPTMMRRLLQIVTVAENVHLTLRREPVPAAAQ